jgi:hypothetical protein
MVSHPGPRLAEALEMFARAIHGDRWHASPVENR